VPVWLEHNYGMHWYTTFQKMVGPPLSPKTSMVSATSAVNMKMEQTLFLENPMVVANLL